jgi:hypothetical protein
MKAFVESTGGAPVQVKSHPIRFGSGDWTRVVGELEERPNDRSRAPKSKGPTRCR